MSNLCPVVYCDGKMLHLGVCALMFDSDRRSSIVKVRTVPDIQGFYICTSILSLCNDYDLHKGVLNKMSWWFYIRVCSQLLIMIRLLSISLMSHYDFSTAYFFLVSSYRPSIC